MWVYINVTVTLKHNTTKTLREQHAVWKKSPILCKCIYISGVSDSNVHAYIYIRGIWFKCTCIYISGVSDSNWNVHVYIYQGYLIQIEIKSASSQRPQLDEV